MTRADHPDERVVNHFQFFSLLDNGVPKDSSVFLSFINKINKWRRVNGPKVSYYHFPSNVSCSVIIFEIEILPHESLNETILNEKQMIDFLKKRQRHFYYQ